MMMIIIMLPRVWSHSCR